MADEGKVKYWYENQQTIVRLTGEISNDTIFELCDEIDLAIGYYHYRQVEIQLDSPGGDVDSLVYFLTKLKEWKLKKVRVATLGMTYVCSAAACILSMGDVGFRKVYVNARLLYHQSSRWNVNHLTINEAENIKNNLQESTTMMVNALAGHVLESKGMKDSRIPVSQTLEDLQKTYTDLFKMNEGEGIYINPDQALKYYLVDIIAGRS